MNKMSIGRQYKDASAVLCYQADVSHVTNNMNIEESAGAILWAEAFAERKKSANRNMSLPRICQATVRLFS